MRPRSAAHGVRRWRPATAGLLAAAAVLLATASGAVAPSQSMAQSGSRSAPAASSTAAAGTLAARPYMGWTSWDTFRCDISATLIEQQALLMHDKLQRYGYRYVNIDSDCGNFVVNKYGYSVYNPSQFPGGIAPVARYVHHLGLKLGVYAVPGIPIQAVQENTPIEGTPYHAQDDNIVNVFEQSISLQAGKTVQSVTLPNVSSGVVAGSPSLHVFAIAIGG